LGEEEASFAKALSQALDDQLGAVLSVQRRQSFVLRGQLAQSYTAERVALVGDAMHVIHPLAGQGLNLGLNDLEPLVQVLLGASARGIDRGHPLVLRRYARARFKAVQIMSYTTNTLNNLFCSTNPAVISVRTLGLEAVQKMPWLKKQLAFQAMGI
ncbi:MAG: FAD-dependent monooxygenase, partial [Gammaproteobacteria bacterium]|nr:FAD-dependent monooxygenase [Gammaproteobacteria bacterium]